MIINLDSITLSFLVVSIVTLAVVVVLVWYVYYTRKFKEDVTNMLQEKLEMYLDNLEKPKQEEDVPDELPDLPGLPEPPFNIEVKDETEFAEKREEPQEEEKPQSFVEAPPKVEEQPKNTNE